MQTSKNNKNSRKFKHLGHANTNYKTVVVEGRSTASYWFTKTINSSMKVYKINKSINIPQTHIEELPI